MSNYKNWTQQEDIELNKLVSINKYSFREIGERLNRTGQSCQNHSRYLGLNSKFIKRLYSVNHDFWASINNTTCYWAGFSAADANLQIKSENNCVFRLEIQERDKNHLEKFVNQCQFTGPIKMLNRVSKTAKIDISSSKWGENLKNNFNIIPNKTFRFEPPSFNNDELTYSWLIGYIDGDGTIFYNKWNNSLQVNFISGSQRLIEFIKNLIETKFPLQLRKKEKNIVKNINCWRYSVSGIKACALIDYLKTIDVPKLKRKWENPNVIKYIESQKLKYPHLFNGPASIT